MLQGDKMGVLSEMMANTELDELWSDPAVAHRLLQGKIHRFFSVRSA
jgi:hypothetical protein